MRRCCLFFCFFFNDTASTDIYTYCHTLSLHDALPISTGAASPDPASPVSMSSFSASYASSPLARTTIWRLSPNSEDERSEEHTSELQSLMRISYAVFCLKKKKKRSYTRTRIIIETRYTQLSVRTNRA